MIGYLYILQSEVNGRYYIGSTNDVGKRIAEHNSGKSAYTNITRPFKLVFEQEYKELAIARSAERWLKRQKSKRLIEKIVEAKILEKEF